MKNSEQKAINTLEGAFTSKLLEIYVFTIQDYFADETDQLEIDNPQMETYLNDVIPEFTDDYDNANQENWLKRLRVIIDKARSMATNEVR